jgi:DNA polymerase-3 subunit epsilon
MNLELPLNEYTYIAFDTETSGAYPVGFDIVELGAVKYYKGQEIGNLQFLLKPREAMSDFIIGIHGITNEMVADSPLMKDKVHEIYEFFKGAIVMAHHCPFDLGFLAIEYEKVGLSLPPEPALCTSLLARKLVHGVENHKLQTLVKHFSIDGGQAHRAYDDAKSCLSVGLECFKKLGEEATLAQAIKSQGKQLWWRDYSLAKNEISLKMMIEAIQFKKDIEMVYQGGSAKGEIRKVKPIGIVRNPDGDFLQAFCFRDQKDKRYYLSRIKDVAVVY